MMQWSGKRKFALSCTIKAVVGVDFEIVSIDMMNKVGV